MARSGGAPSSAGMGQPRHRQPPAGRAGHGAALPGSPLLLLLLLLLASWSSAGQGEDGPPAVPPRAPGCSHTGRSARAGGC